jgi:hypothetical protein
MGGYIGRARTRDNAVTLVIMELEVIVQTDLARSGTLSKASVNATTTSMVELVNAVCKRGFALI